MSLPLLESAEYDDAFDRALLGAAEQLAGLGRESRGAEDLLLELLREPVIERQRRILDDERYHSVKLCQLLRTRSKEHWFSDPAAARAFAELAVGVAESLDAKQYGTILTADARALSWGYLGNVLRITSDARRAEGALRQAWSHHRQGTGDLDTEGVLLLFTASLRAFQGRIAEALLRVDQAVSVHRSLGDARREGSTLIKKGIFLAEDGRFREAIAATHAALLRVDAAEDPRLVLMGKQNLATFLVGCGEHREAGRLLGELRALYRDIEEGVLLARIGWLKGNFASGIGNFAEAERQLSKTREFFLCQEIGSDVAFISLHLAELHARAGQVRKVRALLRDVIPLGEAMGFDRVVLAARLLYAQASGR